MTIHEYRPTAYHTTLGPHPAVLSVADGDTVRTSTVDALGYDEADVQVTPEGNPQTGPFFVQGAEPGDGLAVTFDVLQPNRLHGRSTSVIAPHVVSAPHVARLPRAPDPELNARWRVDPESHSAILENEGPLCGLAVPLRPMVGCFGVAPPGHQAITTSTAGAYGGNLDYCGFTAGTTALLPVFLPGALFHIGDGHAAQGVGEITGAGIEISFDVQFTVRLRKAKPIGLVRGWSSSRIFTLGTGRPLDEALQRATTEMLEWLQGDFRLDEVAANLLLSQCVGYEIGNVYNPAFSVACTLETRYLTELQLAHADESLRHGQLLGER
jgi:amidase